ncbi:MAG: 30S ribosomal protein S16 [Actinomycetota bacterium]
MLKIRLTRAGRKKIPFYRVVVADARMPRDGRFIEVIGHYDPKREPSLIKIDEEKARFYLAKGAQPTQAVANLLKIVGVGRKPQVTAEKAEKVAKKPVAKKTAAKKETVKKAEKKPSTSPRTRKPKQSKAKAS